MDPEKAESEIGLIKLLQGGISLTILAQDLGDCSRESSSSCSKCSHMLMPTPSEAEEQDSPRQKVLLGACARLGSKQVIPKHVIIYYPSL